MWVTAEGYEGLTQFTLAVLDVATADPAAKVVEHYRVNEVTKGKDEKGKDVDVHTEKYHVQRYTIRQDPPEDPVNTVEKIIDHSNSGRKEVAIELLKTLRPLNVAASKRLEIAMDSLKKGNGLPADFGTITHSVAVTGSSPTGRLNFFSPS